ncbi:MAG: hypothetical protein ACM3QX_16935 [Syntrophomonadaceae bacterium]
MKVFLIIGYVSRIVWSLPPFRQYKGNFFNYFLIMAMADPVGSFLVWLGYRNSFSVYTVTAAAALLSIIALNKNIRWIPALSFFLFTLAALIFMPLTEVKLIAAAILSALIYYFIRHMIIYAGKYGRVCFFHIIFLIYNLSLVFKLLNVALEFQKGIPYFYATTIFDILLGILFCFFREDDRRFSLKLRKYFIYSS